MKKIAIIGAGIAGLTCGIYAARAGFETELYEKHSIPGGECTGWNRNGYHIDNCAHWIMGAGGKSDLHAIWQTTGALDGVEMLNFDRMYTSEQNGEALTLWKELDRTKRDMLALSPSDKAEIDRLVDYIELSKNVSIPASKPFELMNPIELMKMGAENKNALKLFKELGGESTDEYGRRFKHPLFSRVLSDFVVPCSPAHNFPMAYGNFVGGDGGIPRGGSRAMAERMAERFKSLGGRLFTGKEAVKIDAANSRVHFADGGAAFADYIVCACDASVTFSRLLDKSFMPPQLKAMYDDPSAYRTFATFQAAYSVDSPVDALGGDIMLDCGGIELLLGRMSVKIYAYEPSFAPAGKNIMQVLAGSVNDAYEQWRALSREEYSAKKTAIAQSIQQLLEARFPEYAGKLSLLDCWTPLTYERYCGAYRGYYQSFSLTPASKEQTVPAAIKGLPNVYLTGQWLVPPGGLPGAAIQGKFTLQRILKKEKLSVNI